MLIALHRKPISQLQSIVTCHMNQTSLFLCCSQQLDKNIKNTKLKVKMYMQLGKINSALK